MSKVLQSVATLVSATLGRIEIVKLDFYAKHAVQVQSFLLKRIVKSNAKTEYGKLHNFKDVKSVQDYQTKIPLSDYDDYQPYVERMVQTGERGLITSKRVKRFAESSGSVGKPKLIPMTFWNLWVNQCFSVSYPVGRAQQFFKQQGKRLPPQKGLMTMEGTMTPLPGGGTSSDLSSLPIYYIRHGLKYAMTSPLELVFPKPGEVSKTNLAYFKIRFALMDPSVGYMTSMIVNVLETLFYYLEENWELLCDDIEKGTIDESIQVSDHMRKIMMKHIRPMPERAAKLRAEFSRGFDETLVKRIWPNMGWMFLMGAGSLGIYRKKLGRFTGDMPIYHMGYGASESLMAVPTAINSKDFIVLPHNCFMEFMPVDAPDGTRPLTISEVQVGQEYEVVLTNCSGLYRYCIHDVVKVTGFYKQSPTITFMYRSSQILNISGEKTTSKHLEYAVDKLCEEKNVLSVGHSIYADTVTSTPGHYEIFIEFTKPVPQSEREEYRRILDKYLCEANTFMQYMKDMKAFGDPQLHFLKQGTYNEYWEQRKQEGINLTQVKPVVLLNTDEKREFILAHVADES